MMTQRVRVGDVFLIPIDGPRFGVGQVAGDWKGELYLVIYDAVTTGNVDLPDALRSKPLFAALSLDAKIHNGDWKIIGNVMDNLGDVPQPVFKVHEGTKVFIETRDRSATRPATEEEADLLRLRTVVAPIRLEKALKAHHGLGEWNPKYEELRADYAAASSRVITA